jgi:hypothetical protein
MRETATMTVPDQHRIARAFLALTDDPELETVQRSLSKAAAAFAAMLVLALAAPLMWIPPTQPAAPVTPGKVGDQPAATLGNSKAALAAADDEDADGGE